MSAISWSGLETFTAPASLSTASSGDDWFRSFLTSVALGLQPSYFWPGSGGGSLASIGIANFGTARCNRQSNASVVGGLGNGFLYWNAFGKTWGSLHHVGSASTAMLGHAFMEDHGAGAGRWLTQTGTGTLSPGSNGSFGTLSVSFASGYAVAPPFVRITNVQAFDPGLPFYWLNVSSISTGGFTSVYSLLRNLVGADQYTWESDGTL